MVVKASLLSFTNAARKMPASTKALQRALRITIQVLPAAASKRDRRVPISAGVRRPAGGSRRQR